MIRAAAPKTPGIPTAHRMLLLLRSLSPGLFSPVLPLLLVQKGCSVSTVALVIGAHAFAAVALELPSGVFADTLGRKRTYLVSLCARAVFLVLLVCTRGTAAMLLACVLQGVATAFSSGSVEALVLEQTIARGGKQALPAASRAISMLDTAGVALGALLGGVVAAFTGNYLWVALPAALCILAEVAFCLGTVQETPRAQKPDSILACIRQSAGFVRKSRRIQLLLVLGAACGLVLCALENYWQLALVDLGSFGAALLGPLNFAAFAAALCGNWAAGRLLARGKNSSPAKWWRVLLGLRFAMAAALVLFSLYSGMAGFVVAYLLVYLLLGGGNIAENALLAAEAPESVRASLMSVNSLAWRAGVLVGAPYCAATVAGIGYSGVWLSAAVALALTAALCVLPGRRVW